jgi:hypothetical protein
MAAVVELARKNNKVELPRRLAPEVQAKLEAAEARLAELETKIADLALDEAIGAAGASERVAKFDKELVGTRNTVDRLRVALATATERDAAADAAERRAVQAQQFNQFEKHVAAREEAMTSLCDLIERATSAYAQFTAATARMIGSLPVGCSLPAGLTAGELSAAQTARLIKAEMWRYSGVGQIGDFPRSLPGGAPPEEFYRYFPTDISPATETVKQQGEFILSAVRRQTQEAE